MTPSLKIIQMTYPRELELAWRQSCEMLNSSQACQYLKDILCGKASRRRAGTRRFFGEAYVATQVPHVEGYYGSFKWLTNLIFLGNKPFPSCPTQAFQLQYRSALHRHFRENLERLQQNASKFKLKAGIKPATPDLWLLGAAGNHRFIEVKLPKDEVGLSQIAGLSLIASSFSRPNLSVEIVELSPDRKREFEGFVEAIDSSANH
ncbi:MAG: hypothetical protein WAK95_08505 [Desulfobacterales bacterium]